MGTARSERRLVTLLTSHRAGRHRPGPSHRPLPPGCGRGRFASSLPGRLSRAQPHSWMSRQGQPCEELFLNRLLRTPRCNLSRLGADCWGYRYWPADPRVQLQHLLPSGSPDIDPPPRPPDTVGASALPPSGLLRGTESLRSDVTWADPDLEIGLWPDGWFFPALRLPRCPAEGASGARPCLWSGRPSVRKPHPNLHRG